MRRPLVLAAAALAAAAPVALASPDGHGKPDRPGKPERPAGPQRVPAPTVTPDRPDGGPGAGARPEAPVESEPRAPGKRDGAPEVEGVRYALSGIVMRNARARAVRVKVLRANPQLKTALAEVQAPSDETEQTRPTVLRVRIGPTTAIVSRSRAKGPAARGRARPKERSNSLRPRAGATYRALRRGDRVAVVWRAPAGLAATDLPAATRIVDRGPRKGGPSGAAFTTNHDGTAVNVNRYGSAEDVYLNGGPSCGAQRHAAALPDGRYVFQVTTPNGRKLSSRHISKRSFVMRDSVVVSSSAPTNPLGCDIAGLVVQVGPFRASPNGVYKLWIAPAATVKAGTFVRSASKTDNFKIDPALGGDPDGPAPDPSPDDDPTPDPGEDPPPPGEDPPPPPDGGGPSF